MMRAKLFQNGRSQAVRLPASCRFEGTEVHVERDPATGAVVLTPVRSSPLDWLRQRAELLEREEGEPGFGALFDDLNNLRDGAAPQQRPWP